MQQSIKGFWEPGSSASSLLPGKLVATLPGTPAQGLSESTIVWADSYVGQFAVEAERDREPALTVEKVSDRTVFALQLSSNNG
jgi:hypothetical protein